LRDISASIKIEFDITEVNRSSKKITGILVFSSSILLYLVVISDSMNEAITETERRRSIQEKYNKEHGIIPKTIIKDIPEVISNETEKKVEKESKLSRKEKLDLIDSLTKEMKSAASNLDFERAMELRDIIFDLENDK
jgi:excinuclease ABC subunit B